MRSVLQLPDDSQLLYINIRSSHQASPGRVKDEREGGDVHAVRAAAAG